jgi:DNA mismatch repair protein MutS
VDSNLEAVERNRTGIKTLKVGYNKVFGYYIEITRANAEIARRNIFVSKPWSMLNAISHQNLKNMKLWCLSRGTHSRSGNADISRIFATVVESSQPFIEYRRILAELDVLASLAEAAMRGGYCRPELTNDDVLEIQEGRHPVVETALSSERFIPNDTMFNTGERIRIITGPNMSGKSTYLRQVALITLMAQIGSFIPAKSARLGLVDRIFTRIGAQDEIFAGQSTFMWRW